jgi:integrase
MASVFNRGTRANPKFYVRVKADGRWLSRRTHALTLAEARRIAATMQAREERVSLGLEAPAHASLSARSLLEGWAAALTNRGAKNDRYRIAKHLVPRFGALRIVELTSPAVVLWLDDLAAAPMKPGSARGLLALLSRFCSWCCDRGYLAANPVKAIPAGRRPRGSQGGGADKPWIADDATVLSIFEALPEPIRFVWFLTNRAGLRCGEACGLRLSDLDGMRDGAIRVRFNYGSPMLKEAKGTPKTKWVPAPADLPEYIGAWLDRRRAETADPEALVFPDADGYVLNKDQVGAAWRRVRDELGLPLELTAHRSGRHSFASRLLAAGAGVTEVSSALGHADGGRLLMATYNHHVRRTWSPALVAPMQVGAKVIPLRAAAAPAADNANDSRKVSLGS